ncbi:hypothetical protein DRQ09_02700, partial [candidate division KSB1 bacterium]
MRINRKTLFFTAILLLFLSFKSLNSQSAYSSGGIGELRHFINVRATGLGGSGISLIDEYSMNFVNPSLWSYIKNTTINGSFLYEGITTKVFNNRYNLDKSQFQGAGVVITGEKKFAVGVGVTPLSDADYKIKVLEPDTSKVKFLTGNGGVSKIFLGFALSPRKFFSFGFSLNYILGKFEEIWRVNFKEKEYTYFHSVVQNYINGVDFTVGAVFLIKDILNFGITYNSVMRLNSKLSLTTPYIKEKEEPEAEIRVPNSFGLGASIYLSKRVLLTGDFFRRNFKNLRYNNRRVNEFKNSNRISFGLEFTPQEQKKSSYRFGIYQFDSYLSSSYVRDVRERGITLGYGFIFSGGMARLDMASEFSIRSSHSDVLSSEKIFRFLLSISGGEEWFIR